jgi:hypothetical protein
VVSCTITLTPEAFLDWINNPNNGLVKERSIDYFKLQVKYRPNQYIKRIQSVDTTTTTDVTEEDRSTQHFELKILPNDVFKKQWLQWNKDNMYYLSFRLAQDIRLISDGDTLEPSYYHVERAYNLEDGKKVLLGFENLKPNADRVLTIDSEVIPIGKVNFLFEGNDITKANSIQLK